MTHWVLLRLYLQQYRVERHWLFACRTSAGHLSFICYEHSMKFSTLKTSTRGRVYDAFRACRARAATCGAEQWALNMFIPQLHTLQVTKIWSGPINEARVRDIRAISAGNARAATVELNSECGWHVPHSHLYTCKRLSGCILHMWHAWSMIGICIVSNTTTGWLWSCDVVTGQVQTGSAMDLTTKLELTQWMLVFVAVKTPLVQSGMS